MCSRRTLSLCLAILIAWAFLLGSYLLAQARTSTPMGTITVDSTADDGSGGCTLREAIQAANTDSAVGDCAAGSGADTIAFAISTDSTITLNGSQLPIIDDTLTIDGSTAGDLTISGDNASRVFEIGSGTAVTLTQLTIVDGNADYGAGILNGDADSPTGGGVTLVLQDSTLSDNTAEFWGGGIFNYNVGGTMTVENSTLSGNVAGVEGGGIYNHGGTMTVENSTLSGNEAGEEGGGIYNYVYGTVTVANSTLSDNSAEVYGGSIYNDIGGALTVANSTLSDNVANTGGGGLTNTSTLTVTNSTFSGNSAEVGGGIFNHGGTLTVVDSTLSDNSAGDGGGGVWNTGTLTVTNSTLSGNAADSIAGGIFNGDTLTVTSSTLSDNTAEWGGGIGNFGTLTVMDSTLSDNTAEVGGGIGNFGTLTVTNGTLSGNAATAYGGGLYNYVDRTMTVTNSTLSGNTAATTGGGIYNAPDGVVLMTNSMAANSPLGHDCWNDGTVATFESNLVESGNCGDAITDDPRLGPLQNNGGATHTHALLPGSPALDAAEESVCPIVDQRGVPRPQGEGCDIGAFESQGFTPPMADAGADQQLLPGQTGQLDGSGSYDPDGNQPLSYTWEQTGGPAVALSDSTVVSPTFVAPANPTVLTFVLTVTDNYGLSTTDAVVVEVGSHVYLPLLHVFDGAARARVDRAK